MKLFSKFCLGLFSAAVIASVVIPVFRLNLWAKNTAPAIQVDSTPINRSASPVGSFAPIVKKVAPSVVNIYSSRTVKIQPHQNPFQNDPLFRQFFGEQNEQNDNSDQPTTRREEGAGSGVIVSTDGYILTANHVVDEMDEIKVAVPGIKKEFTAKIIGKDRSRDVAVLKIEANNLPAITLADSDQLEVGDIVLAIGNPFDVGQTVTMGIISGLGRYGYGINGRNGYENFIQTDAAINPGNSGGALVDMQGRFVGINTWIASSSGGSEGVGFAVPINVARRVMENLLNGGKVTRGYLGILPQDITPDFAEQFNLKDQNGALVGDVRPNSPAQKAGIKSGDVIVAINGKPISDAHNLQLTVWDFPPGTSISIKLLRNGTPKNLNVTVGEFSLSRTVAREEENSSPVETHADALDGVTVADWSSEVAGQLKIPSNLKGALVQEIAPDSNSADDGLQANDIIVEINHQPVADANAAVKLCRQARGSSILLKIWRREGGFAGTSYLSVDNTAKK
jgi:serine protease Do